MLKQTRQGENGWRKQNVGERDVAIVTEMHKEENTYKSSKNTILLYLGIAGNNLTLSIDVCFRCFPSNPSMHPVQSTARVEKERPSLKVRTVTLFGREGGDGLRSKHLFKVRLLHAGRAHALLSFDSAALTSMLEPDQLPELSTLGIKHTVILVTVLHVYNNEDAGFHG